MGVLVASLPFVHPGPIARAQTQFPGGPVLRESQPPADLPAVNPAPDDTVTTAPLPPPDDRAAPDDTRQLMVPNPLEDPNTVRVPGAGKGGQQPKGQAQGQPQRGGWVAMGTATLQALDKVNAHYDTLTVKVGQTGHFGSLDIAVRGCFVRSSDQPADATAFLVIRDQRADGPAFSGWMVRSAPSMSMLAHAIYDVRVTGCAP